MDQTWVPKVSQSTKGVFVNSQRGASGQSSNGARVGRLHDWHSEGSLG